MNTQAGPQRKRNEARDALVEVKNDLALMKQNFISALPKTIPSDKFIRIAMTLVQLKPELLWADRKSFLVSLQRCASDGLLPDGREATVMLFNDGDQGGKQAVYVPMYQGLLKQIRNSGELKEVTANVVYENDVFKYVQGDEEKITHEPKMDGSRGKPKAAYAIVKTKDGGVYRAVLTKEKLQELQKRSPAGKKNKGPWQTDPDEMWKKSAIRAVSKIAPKSSELDRYIEVVRDQDDPVGQNLVAFEESPMPDENSMQTVMFHLKAAVLQAFTECETEDKVNETWRTYVGECKKIDQATDVEVEAARNDRIEAIKQAAAKP